MATQRLHFLDYGKVLAIIVVVIEHVAITANGAITLFVLPLFFLISGYNFSLKNHATKASIWKRFKRIMIPFWEFMLLYGVLEIARASLFGYGDIRIILPDLVNALYGSGEIPELGALGNTLSEIMSYKAQTPGIVDLILPTNCHLWFLPAAFTGFLLFIGITKLAEKSNHSMAVYCVSVPILLAMAGLENLDGAFQLPYSLGRGFFACACMIGGLGLKRFNLLEGNNKTSIGIAALCSLILSGMAIYLGCDGSSVVRSVYGQIGYSSVFVCFAGGMGSAYLVLLLFRAFEKVCPRVIDKALCILGENTMSIYLWEFVLLFVMDVFFIYVIGIPAQPDQWHMGLISSDYLLIKSIECVIVLVVPALIANRLHRKKISPSA